MTIREITEDREYQFFSRYASHSRESAGRDREEKQDDIRTVYQRDRDRILHSKSFRRLKHKTQVFIAPLGDHYRTRLTHTLEVSQISRTVARALWLNDDLTEAIALGHDLGHTPFGHAGERVLNQICPLGFKHYEQSIRVVELLEKDGEGLNLTKEVRDGILNHQWNLRPRTLEGQIVRFCDKIAYINHDIDDAERAGLLTEGDIPAHFRKTLGNTARTRLNTMVTDVIRSSMGSNKICMSPEMENEMLGLRQFMFENLYTNNIAIEEEIKVSRLLTLLYEYYEKHIEKLPYEYAELIRKGEKAQRVVCDYISGMSDQYAVMIFEELYIPKSWPGQ